MTWLEAILIAIVEGITEFLPISSTGHMIITQHLLGVPSTDFVKAFTVNIQFGAILSVIVLYWKRFFQGMNFYYKLFIACLPLGIAYILEKQVDAMLESVLIVAIALVVGGIFLLFADRLFPGDKDLDEGLSYRKSFIIGLIQIISIIPGVSRSGATIIGGMSQKLNRKSAAEFSFFLAVPTMFAATALKVLDNYKTFSTGDIKLLAVGNLVAFVVAMIAIRTFITFLTRHGFRLFGWYRIVVGLLILILLAFGVDLSIV
jgi:undecaprenyl-diphosphatase